MGKSGEKTSKSWQKGSNLAIADPFPATGTAQDIPSSPKRLELEPFQGKE
jgi:hypothetical protein